MRVRVRHEITHRFEPAARQAIATLRLTPRSHVGQHILRWTLDVTPDARLMAEEDAFGNLVHSFSAEGTVEAMTVVAEGEVDAQDTTGIVAGSAERFPPSLFLRQTMLTEPDEAIHALAAEIAAEAKEPLARLHALMVGLHERFPEAATDAETAALPAAKVLAAGTGTSAELSHLFLSAARALRIPARQVSGYAAQDDASAAYREWAEAHVPGIGWVGFDCGANLCPTESYVRLAAGLDSHGVAPMLSTGISAQNKAVACDALQKARPASPAKQSQKQRQQ